MNGNETCQRVVDTLWRKEAGSGSSSRALPFDGRCRSRRGGGDRLRVALRHVVPAMKRSAGLRDARGDRRSDRRVAKTRRCPRKTGLPTLPLSSGRLPRVRSFFVFSRGRPSRTSLPRPTCRLRLRVSPVLACRVSPSHFPFRAPGNATLPKNLTSQALENLAPQSAPVHTKWIT